jgi:hypothetical protein
MPKRTASFTKRLADNAKALHRATTSRPAATGADKKPSEAEAALIEERRLLKEDRDQRREKAKLPGPTALDKLVRTRRPQAKTTDKPKAGGQAQDAKETKKPKAQKTRAEKQAVKAAALEAGRRAPKKPAK